MIKTKDYKQNKTVVLDSIDITAAQTISGTNAIFSVSAVAAAYALTVANFDYSEYALHDISDKPCVKIKCSADCSVQNLTVTYPDSASSTANYVFNTDCSLIPKYLILKPVENTDYYQLA